MTISVEMAEWSKALVSGTSRNRRGFEPHFRQYFSPYVPSIAYVVLMESNHLGHRINYVWWRFWMNVNSKLNCGRRFWVALLEKLKLYSAEHSVGSNSHTENILYESSKHTLYEFSKFIEILTLTHLSILSVRQLQFKWRSPLVCACKTVLKSESKKSTSVDT